MKLVRDKIPDIIKKEGKTPVIHIAGGEEYAALLKKKLMEETAEYAVEPSTDELVDILEVVYALAQCHGKNKEELEALRAKKTVERGSFVKHIVWEKNA